MNFLSKNIQNYESCATVRITIAKDQGKEFKSIMTWTPLCKHSRGRGLGWVSQAQGILKGTCKETHPSDRICLVGLP